MIHTRNRASPGRAASSNSLPNNGIQTIVLKNVLLKEEQKLSRIAKNRTKVGSGELRKTADTALALTPCVGAVGFYFIYLDSSWRTHGKRRVEAALY
jgi:hypothetical protein